MCDRISSGAVPADEKVASASLRSLRAFPRYFKGLPEEPEEEDPIDMTEEDIGLMFILLKTVVDVLDRKG